MPKYGSPSRSSETELYIRKECVYSRVGMIGERPLEFVHGAAARLKLFVTGSEYVVFEGTTIGSLAPGNQDTVISTRAVDLKMEKLGACARRMF